MASKAQCTDLSWGVQLCSARAVLPCDFMILSRWDWEHFAGSPVDSCGAVGGHRTFRDKDFPTCPWGLRSQFLMAEDWFFSL